jgi:hypothetical protein
MTPQDIETMARRMLNAVGSTFWSQEEIIENYLYWAVQAMAARSLCIENRYTTSTVADQEEYEAPDRAIQIKYVSYDGSTKLKPITRRQRRSIDLNTNTTVTGTPQYYEWFDSTLILFPTPDEAKTLEIWSYDDASVPTASSSLEIPTRYHTDLAVGVAYFMSQKELGHPNTSFLNAKWEDSLERIEILEKRRRRGDGPIIVQTEENLPMTYLGNI